MSNVAAFPAQSSASASKAVHRLNEIWTSVETFTRQVEYDRVTPVDMLRILRIFNTANSCIRIVLSDFKDDPAIDQLVSYSCGITGMIEQARQKVAGLIDGSRERVPIPKPFPAGRLGD
ncbi:hypothetical protein L6654_33435 [Bradyrhizobium sp. WYCCWR 13023]|uniref:Uncharacterized protein n=1 Tax=Bradyrhizobium zhengyangense TaxID=2911009 RepID=A0A9X1UE11_9BRAD|nr:hypothetical protein [Bradyrhizobium zhengyangense]MCG2631543.1 hypothetical protein [Bradyrhizobium zhengyangense]MCG2638635.1 hypothetical protein [Bradyrhizobium zhengyangense]MCG2669016.1 hypothetical protein [Bradyrhizobium zhengyangense]